MQSGLISIKKLNIHIHIYMFCLFACLIASLFVSVYFCCRIEVRLPFISPLSRRSDSNTLGRGHARHGLGFLGSSLLWHLRRPGWFLIWVKLTKHGMVCDYRLLGALVGGGWHEQKTTRIQSRDHTRECCRLFSRTQRLKHLTFYIVWHCCNLTSVMWAEWNHSSSLGPFQNT